MRSYVIAFMMVLATICSLNSMAQSTTSLTINQIEANGDVDGNGIVNITDVMVMVNYLVGMPVAFFDLSQGDFDHDELITITDVVMLVNIVVGNDHGDDIPLMESYQANPLFRV
jgi:hypothetical protein